MCFSLKLTNIDKNILEVWNVFFKGFGRLNYEMKLHIVENIFASNKRLNQNILLSRNVFYRLSIEIMTP